MDDLFPKPRGTLTIVKSEGHRVGSTVDRVIRTQGGLVVLVVS